MLKDRISHAKHELLFCEETDATKTPGTGIDLQGYSAATVVCSVGALTNSGSSPPEKWEFKLEESDSSGSGFSAVDSDDILLDYGKNDGSVSSGVFATVDADTLDLDENQNISVGYIGSKRYIRVVATPSNTPGNTPLAVSVIKEGLQKPTDD